MDKYKFCEEYDVPIQVIDQFIKEGLLDEFESEIKEHILSDLAVHRLESCICLYSLGLDVKNIKNYIFLEISNKDTRKERIQILQKYREHNLKAVHKTKKTMDCIDCILQELKMEVNI